MLLTLVIVVLLLSAATLGVGVALLVRAGRPASDSPDLDAAFDRLTRAIRDEAASDRAASDTAARTQREELATLSRSGRDELMVAYREFREALDERIARSFTEHGERLEGFARRLADLAEQSERRGETLRQSVEQRLDRLREENARKLDEMRQTVDEKLQGTLEKRLGESFRQVSERLEQVHKGLGEMQSLATGVGDLKRVMTNVSTRGAWGEVQLGAILEQMLAPSQYDANVAVVPDSPVRVEFAIRLPGRGDDPDGVVWLPIDAKFPIEDYQRLLDAEAAADREAMDQARRQLEQSVKNSAKTIQSKYVAPPHTTDFAILFLPTEGLYAEVVRRPGLVEHCQRECRVVIAGPTTLAAILNSLQMGFRTLAIQKRSGEVWEVLGAVKTEFGKFGGVLEKVRKKLQEATKTMDDADVRTRAMSRRLRAVEQLPDERSRELLGLVDDGVDEALTPD